jgi:hypothetical protein
MNHFDLTRRSTRRLLQGRFQLVFIYQYFELSEDFRVVIRRWLALRSVKRMISNWGIIKYENILG